MLPRQRCASLVALFCCFTLGASPAWTAPPSVENGLELTPVQENVSFDTPTKAEIAKCTIKNEKDKGGNSWIVRGPAGRILRRFTDSNGDNVVDTWSYYQSGVEVYRDVDSNFNGKADEYRWFHTAGIRWGIDKNEDGTIDFWKLISPEEVAEEVVTALRAKDKGRFQNLLITKQEIGELGLSKEQAEKLQQRTGAASATFGKLVSAGSIGTDGEFSDFGGLKPGMVPAGTQGSTKDVVAYENVWAMVQTGGEHKQLQLGTMIRVGGRWKLIDGPTMGPADEVASGFFFTPGGGAPPVAMAQTENPPSEKMQEILAELEKLDQQLAGATGKEANKHHIRRANLLRSLAKAATSKEDREQWYRQVADMVSASAHDGSFPQGIEYLKTVEKELAKDKESDNLLAYFEFHRMLAHYYGVTMAKPDVDYSKAQAQWLEDLEGFVKRHPKSEHSAEAMYQLAMGSELSGETETAVKWYKRITEDFPQSSTAPKAGGAAVRLTCEGKPIALKGRAIEGGDVDLKGFRGKAVIIQYWTTSCEVCKADHAVLKDLYAKYGGSRLEVIGVNLDFAREPVIDYLKSNRLPWKQLHEEGGFESRLAAEMGVVTVPLMLLVDPQGKVVSNNIQAAELEAALKSIKVVGNRSAKR